MKNARFKKVIGIAISERSLIVAEIAAGADRPAITRPSVVRLAEMPFPPGVTVAEPARIGTALAEFLTSQLIASRAAVIGLPARWIVAQPKEVPSVDEATLSNILRLQAEAEFSTELKDLVYDYSGGWRTGAGGEGASGDGVSGDAASTQTILLAATPKKYIDLANTIAAAAKLNLVAITASAMVLGDLSSSGNPDSLVLAVGAVGGELTAQRLQSPAAIRHLRAPTPSGPFISELRRIVSTMPTESRREMVLWDDTGIDVRAMGEQIGVNVRSGDLPMLGVDADLAASNGHGRKFAAAVALALAGLSPQPMAVDFAHSRLAPPKEQLIPRWAIGAGLGVILLISLIVWSYSAISAEQSKVDAMQASLDQMRPHLADASAFVDKVSFAQAWHGDDPRYLAAIRDITMAMSDDPQTFATSLNLREVARPNTAVASAKAPPDTNQLTGTLQGRTTNLERVTSLSQKMQKNDSFSDVKTADATIGRGTEVNFTITFLYAQPNAATSSASNQARAIHK